MLEKRLLAILACPVCKGNLVYKTKPESLTCRKCRVTYPVENGIPNLLPRTKNSVIKKQKKRKN